MEWRDNSKNKLDESINFIIQKIATEKAEEIYHAMRKEPFPENIKLLLNAKSKKDVKKISKKMMVSMKDLAIMRSNADIIGFNASFKHLWFFPEDVLHTEEEREAFSTNAKVGPIVDKKIKKFVTKIFEQVRKRKHIAVHLLEKGSEWHIFYFDFNDAYVPTGYNHYKGGPHIHYISFLFGENLDKNFILESLEKRKTKIDSIHIKFLNQESNAVSVEEKENN